MYAGGGCFNGRDVKINISNSAIYFMGGSRIPSQLFQCKTLHAIDAQFYFSYGKAPSMMAISADHAIFDNCKLDNPILLSAGVDDLRYINCDIGQKNVDKSYIENVTSVPSIVTVNNKDSWSFISDNNKIQIGQYVVIWKTNIKSEFNFGNPLPEPAGTIQSINGKVVMVSGNPYGITTGRDLDITIYKINL